MKCGILKGLIGLLQAGGKEEEGNHEFSLHCLPWSNFGTPPCNASRSVADLLLQVTWMTGFLLMTLFDDVVLFPLPEPQRTQPVGQGNREPPVRPSQVDVAPMPCKHFISPGHNVPQGVVLQREDVQAGQQLGRCEYSVRSDCLFQGTAERKLAAWLRCAGAWVANIKTWRGE